MQPMSSNDIAHFLEQLCATTFEGGRIVKGPDKILLYDVPCWPSARSDALRQRFPHCDVDIHQAQCTSASGFVVVITTRDHISYLSVCFAVSMSIVMALLAGAAATSVFLGDHPDWGDLNFYTVHNESTEL
jgi:hypothetical protein